ELMPWSAKAQDLIRNQYAAVGTAARVALGEATSVLRKVHQAKDLLSSFSHRVAMSQMFVHAYRKYCWRVESISELKLAAFHLMATEKKVHVNQNHAWHMDVLTKISNAEPGSVLTTTEHRVVDLTDMASQEKAIQWWNDLTEKGGEGMVVKPID